MPMPMPASIHMSTCMSIHMSIHMSILMFIYMSVHMSTDVYTHVYTHMPISVSTQASLYTCLYMPTCTILAPHYLQNVPEKGTAPSSCMAKPSAPACVHARIPKHAHALPPACACALRCTHRRAHGQAGERVGVPPSPSMPLLVRVPLVLASIVVFAEPLLAQAGSRFGQASKEV